MQFVETLQIHESKDFQLKLTNRNNSNIQNLKVFAQTQLYSLHKTMNPKIFN